MTFHNLIGFLHVEVRGGGRTASATGSRYPSWPPLVGTLMRLSSASMARTLDESGPIIDKTYRNFVGSASESPMAEASRRA